MLRLGRWRLGDDAGRLHGSIAVGSAGSVPHRPRYAHARRRKCQKTWLARCGFDAGGAGVAGQGNDGGTGALWTGAGGGGKGSALRFIIDLLMFVQGKHYAQHLIAHALHEKN